MSAKTKAINEFREYCLIIHAPVGGSQPLIGRVNAIADYLSNLQDNASLAKQKADELLVKYELAREDVWEDFDAIIREVFHP